MNDNPEPRTTYEYITGDFCHAWDALASKRGEVPRGNFTFGLLAMILLEWASRLCKSDRSGNALDAFSQALCNIDMRYFSRLPGVEVKCGKRQQFTLPSGSSEPKEELLAVLYDLIRNGEAHLYNPINPVLKDGGRFVVQLTGAEQKIQYPVEQRIRKVHLSYRKKGEDIALNVQTDFLFCDIAEAIKRSGILDQRLQSEGFARKYNVDSEQLANALRE